ncbi:alanine racemase [Simiduia agarivorans]|uniref:Alanine racemase N-terminal domain-containing protein n=1 Tax=Simiduia agarivorans (strain DSM 21679 / JCM 13881 / BCRC 17597 / SA1) TaxID=1117647 RepID=K4KMA3_SIMAS|nr:alanine racemase [Simiduia agarivorans]AFV00305.1 hypothetical protein M5M_15860 [Simiduia agarivorans SA1 = DSM 21679]
MSPNDDFTLYRQVLQQHGDGRPRLLLDLQRLGANADRACGLFPGQPLRLVVKSLPCLPLLRWLSQRMGTRRFMVFHWPFLQQLLSAMPDADVLLGKPMPVLVLTRLLAAGVGAERLASACWLVDSAERIDAYAGFARAHGLRLRVAVEVDVGMARGGVRSPYELQQLLARWPEALELEGLMGYDAQVAKAPWWWGGSRRAYRQSQDRYREFIGLLAPHQRRLLNGAGSPTLPLHGAGSVANDFSLGSCLLKPTDFDLPQLAVFTPALLIAAPVLKRLRGVTLPFVGRLASPLGGRDSLFLYGGRWMAKPCWPEAMATQPWYGLSSNQQLMTLPAQTPCGPDDYVFFRPTQSEAVMLQFGDLWVLNEDRSMQAWPVMSNEVSEHPDVTGV